MKACDCLRFLLCLMKNRSMSLGSAFACITLLGQSDVATGQYVLLLLGFGDIPHGLWHQVNCFIGCVSKDLLAMTPHRVCRPSGCASWGCWEKVCTVRSTWFPPTSQSLHTQRKGRTSGLRARENFQARSEPLLSFLLLLRS